jgi:2-methylcitrate dehydratase PrpD
MLAEQGVKGPPAIFEGTNGFFTGITRHPVTLEQLAGEEGNNHPFSLDELLRVLLTPLNRII